MPALTLCAILLGFGIGAVSFGLATRPLNARLSLIGTFSLAAAALVGLWGSQPWMAGL